jgi:hypothetical protein
MMQTVFKETKEAQVKWWAAQDAQLRNSVNKTQWPQEIQLRVQRMLSVLDILYAGRIYEAYGKKRVAIKIDRPQVKDPKWLAMLEEEWTQQGVTKTLTPQGILYKVA